MRGSIYYQTAELAKLVFKEGSKKKDRSNREHPDYQYVASFVTMQSYREVWNNFFIYLREQWDLNDCVKIREAHVLISFVKVGNTYDFYQVLAEWNVSYKLGNYALSKGIYNFIYFFAKADCDFRKFYTVHFINMFRYLIILIP